MMHNLWLSFGKSAFAKMAHLNSDGQLKSSAALPAPKTAQFSKLGRKDMSPVIVLVESGASGHYLGDAFVPGLRCTLANYQMLDMPGKITATGGY